MTDCIDCGRSYSTDEMATHKQCKSCATPAPAGDVGKLIERLEARRAFNIVEQRDENDEDCHRAADAIRHLSAEKERLEAEIVGESATAHFQEARAKELEAALDTIVAQAGRRVDDTGPTNFGLLMSIHDIANKARTALATKGGSGE